MRRSGAPSSLPASKRPRFTTPFSAGKTRPSQQQENVNSLQSGGSLLNEDPVASSAPADSSSSSTRLKEVLARIRRDSTKEAKLPPPPPPPSSTPETVSSMPLGGHSRPACEASLPSSSIPVPVVKETETKPKPAAASALGSEFSELSGQRYYSVMWCKRSNKKHKSWEGDAVLIVRGTSVTLKDMDGKDIGKALGYKRSELSGLDDGSNLFVGGKEIEVMGEVAKEDYASGKCFTGAASIDTTPATPDTTDTTVAAPSRKKFRPFNSHKDKSQSLSVPVQPMFDPTAPGALVMPHPTARHQLEQNVGGLPMTEVIVDPHLSAHLRPHQSEGVAFLYQCIMGMRDFSGQGAILADEMGLGKTLQCIAIIWTLLKQGPYGLRPILKKILIITPGSLVKNWEREFRKWLGTERLKVYSVSGDNRAEGFVKSPLYPVLIISYEMFLREEELLRRVNFDLVVCDEGHRLKNTGAKTTSVISGLPTRKRILLTGTPIQNDLQEFFSIVDFCNPSILGSHAAFLKVYEGPILLSRQQNASSEEREVGQARAEELKRLTSLFCLRRTQEIINQYLPPKVESVVFCRMSQLQCSLYKHLLASHLVQSCLRGGHAHSSAFPPHLLCIAALKKLCNSPSLLHVAASNSATNSATPREGGREEEEGDKMLYAGALKFFPEGYDPTKRGVVESGCGKLAVLSEMLHQLFATTREKVVVVSHYTQMLDILEGFCGGRGYSFLRLDGSTPTAKRQAIVERFNSKHSKESVFLLSSKAGGVGLNLIGASRLILYDIDWNPANDLQAMARVWRDGQKKTVHIYRLLTTGSIEEKIFQRQISKQGLNTVLDFDGGRGSGAEVGVREEAGKWEAKFTREELRDLFSLREDTLCDTHDLVRCGCGRTASQPSNSVESSRRAKDRGMEKLLQWEHFSHPLGDSLLSDELLMGMDGAALDKITFVLQSKCHVT